MGKKNKKKHARSNISEDVFISESEEDRFVFSRCVELYGMPPTLIDGQQFEYLEQYMNDYKNPKWETIITREGSLIDVSNVGGVRDPDTKTPIKVYCRVGSNSPIGYPFIWWHNNNSEDNNIICLVHQLVARAFVVNDDPDNKTDINHINGIKNCNWYKNLEWCTRSYNIRESYRMRLRGIGEDHPNAKYSNDQIHTVCILLKTAPSMTYKQIEEATGVEWKTVSDVYTGAYWNHIRRDYIPFPARETKKGELNSAAKYSEEQAEKVCCMLDDVYLGKSTLSHRHIADQCGVSVQMVDKINNGRAWRDKSQSHPFYRAKFERAPD